MTSMTKIMKNDLRKVGGLGRKISPGIYKFTGAVTKGFFKGVYSPFLLNTSIKQIYNSMESNKEYGGLEGYFQANFTAFSFLVLASLSNHGGRLKEYFGALILSNSVDYLINVHRRSKESA